MSSQDPDTDLARKPEVVASFRLYVEDRDKLRKRAESEHRTLSGELRRVVEATLNEDEEAA